jgi:hypothetical protein
VFVIAGLVYGLSRDANRYRGDANAFIPAGRHLGSCLWRTLRTQSVASACRSLSVFPFWNHGVAWVFSRLTHDQLGLWFWMNRIALFLYLLVCVLALRSTTLSERALAVFSLLCSPLLFYVNSAFTELQQGLFVTLALRFWLCHRLWACSMFIFLSILSKDSLLPLWMSFVAFLLLLPTARGPFSQPAEGAPRRSRLKRSLPSVMGVGAGVIVAVLFNWLKYGTPGNAAYIDEGTRMYAVSWEHAVQNLLGSLLSPNGGIVVAYGLFFGLLVLRTGRQRPRGLHLVLAGLVLLNGLAVTAAWWASFGWNTWGQRLVLPYLMPVMYLAIRATNPRSTGRDRPSTQKDDGPMPRFRWACIGRAIVCVVLCSLGLLYNYATLDVTYTRGSPTFWNSLAGTPECQRMLNDPRGIAPFYWECVAQRFRHLPIVPITAIGNARDYHLLALVGASVLVAWLGRRRDPRDRVDESPRPA